MPQGLRGRVALFGAGVVCCSGLVGCLFDEKGKAPPPQSKARAGAVTPPGARTTTPDLRQQVGGPGYPVGGNGISAGGGFQPGINQPPAGTANPNYTGGISGPVVPGNYGAGAPLPGQTPPNIPSVTPPSSNYPPAGYGSSNVGALPTTARAAAPTHPLAPTQPLTPGLPNPPTPTLTDMPIQPPAPPTGGPTAADVLVPTAPAGFTGPLAPPTPPR